MSHAATRSASKKAFRYWPEMPERRLFLHRVLKVSEHFAKQCIQIVVRANRKNPQKPLAILEPEARQKYGDRKMLFCGNPQKASWNFCLAAQK